MRETFLESEREVTLIQLLGEKGMHDTVGGKLKRGKLM